MSTNGRRSGKRARKPFVRRLRHVVAVEVTQPLEVAARADDLFGEGLAPHGGLVHVVPDAVHALRDVVGDMAAPPVARLRPAEVGEVGAPRPDGADVHLAVGVAQEVVAVEPFLRDGIPGLGVLFHAGVHDDDGLEAHLAEVGQQGLGIGEALGVPREDAVAVHVVDVEVEHVGRDLLAAKGLGEGADLGLGVVAPPALLVAERPRRREVHPPCHGCVLLDDGGGRRAAEDDEVERAAGRGDAPRPVVARAETERALVRIVEVEPVEGPAPPDEHERDALINRVGVVAIAWDIAVPHRPRTAPLVHVAGLLSEPEELVVFQREPHAHLVSVPPDPEPRIGREPADLQLTLVAQTDRKRRIARRLRYVERKVERAFVIAVALQRHANSRRGDVLGSKGGAGRAPRLDPLLRIRAALDGAEIDVLPEHGPAGEVP